MSAVESHVRVFEFRHLPEAGISPHYRWLRGPRLIEWWWDEQTFEVVK